MKHATTVKVASLRSGANKRGRPTLFRARFIGEAEKLARFGHTHAEIAEFFEVDERTLRRWRQTHSEFDAALVLGVAAANRRVEMSLYKQALGYEVEEEELRIVRGNIVRLKVKRFVPPSTSATVFWLKAKAGWRDDGGSAPTADPEAPPQESMREVARRVFFLLHKGGMTD